MAQAKSSSQRPQTKYKVSGQVFNSNSEPIKDQSVLAADVDLRGASIYKTAGTVKELKANKGFEFLGTAKTNADGYYEIVFTGEMYEHNEIGLADVVAFAVDDDQITARSKLAAEGDYKNNELTHWDIRLPNLNKRGVSEYARLMPVLEPFVKQSGLQLNQLGSSPDQVDFLAAETKQNAAHTSLAVLADQLKNDCLQENKSVKSRFIIKDIQNFSELFYGIGRQNIKLSWSSLVMKNDQDLQAAITKSIDQNIISSQESILIEAFLAIVRHVALEKSPGAPETADLFKAIGFTLKDIAQQKTFAQTYFQSGNRPKTFWNNLSQQPGFTSDVIQSLQLTNQLSILTGQHTALMEELQVNQAIKDPSDLLTLTPAKWQSIIQKVGVPNSVPGDTPEIKAANYAAGMQNMLNAAYPTQKIALMIKSNQLQLNDANVKEKVSAFFSTSATFDISSSRLTDPEFDSVLKQVAGNQYGQVQKQIQQMQRIFMVSPTPDVMNTLISKGYRSAHHISSISQNTFISLEANDLGGADVAFSVYNRARHQVMRAHHMRLKLYDTQDKATPSKIITAKQQQAITSYLNNLTPSNP
jgi:hypothetical protein